MTAGINVQMPAPPAAAELPRLPQNIMHNLTETMVEFERSAAGFITMDRAVRTLTGKLLPGERPQGIPLLEHPGSADGVNVIETLVIDLGATNEEGKPLVQDEARQYLLGTLCAMHQRRGGMLRRQLQALLEELGLYFQ